MNHKVENCLSAGLQFLLLEIKTLPTCAGDLLYSSWSPVGWSGRGCHVKWLNDSRTECSCNHLTHFAVLMQFDTDSELRTGQNISLQKVGHKAERTKVSLQLWSGKEGPERASQTSFIATLNIIFFPNSHPWPNFSLSYFSRGSHIPCPVNVFPNPALYFVHNGSCFPGIPFQTPRKGWPLHHAAKIIKWPRFTAFVRFNLVIVWKENITYILSCKYLSKKWTDLTKERGYCSKCFWEQIRRKKLESMSGSWEQD